jgi:TPR repeat protein
VIAAAAFAVWLYLYLDRPTRDAFTDADSANADGADAARELIADLEEGEAELGYQRAYEQAQKFQQEARLGDAQVLYFYAAREGHAPSAFALAAMNDPNYHSEQTSLLSEPDPFQAYKWYSVALKHGDTSAAPRLHDLHEWATQAASNGNLEAERLLLQWQ